MRRKPPFGFGLMIGLVFGFVAGARIQEQCDKVCEIKLDSDGCRIPDYKVQEDET